MKPSPATWSLPSSFKQYIYIYNIEIEICVYIYILHVCDTPLKCHPFRILFGKSAIPFWHQQTGGYAPDRRICTGGSSGKVYRAPLRYSAKRTMHSSVPWAYNMKPSFFGRGTKVTTIGTWGVSRMMTPRWRDLHNTKVTTGKLMIKPVDLRHFPNFVNNISQP